jgi:predicted acylesterase/phospholipase RssA
MPCALVLSAGGMFGAYQAGAWKVLSANFQADLVVGASAGTLNAWAIAGGCSPAELCAAWTDRASADLMHLRIPSLPWRGIFDPAPLYRRVDDFFVRFQPRLPFATTLVEVPRLRPVYVTGDRVTPAHLRASCAIPFGFPPVRIDGKLYVDGGLLAAVPLWAAVALGATSAVVVNALPIMPSRFLRAAVGAVRALAAPPAGFQNLEVLEIRPPDSLGRVRDALFWKEENVLRWIAQGESDAAALLNHPSGRFRSLLTRSF